jgi:SAM-dependent methyltransferase
MFPSLYGDGAAYDRMFPGQGDEAAFWAQRLGPAPGPVLLLACGTGRFALPFARAGYAVTGLDLAPAMLAEGERKALRAGLAVTFVQGDLRGFELGQRFANIMLLGNSVAHLHTRADLDAAWQAARAHLAPGGKLSVDLQIPDPALLARPTNEFTPFASYKDPVTERPVELVQRLFYSPKTRLQRVEVFERFSPFAARPAARLELCWHDPEELAASLAAAGFEVLERCGGYDARALSAGAPRHLLTCLGRAA